MVLLLERIGDIAYYETYSTISHMSRRLLDPSDIWLKSDISRLESNGTQQSLNGRFG